MAQHHYYYLFLGKSSIKNLEAKDKFYNYIKQLFFNSKSSKWNTLKYSNFVREHELNFNICYSLLKDFYDIYAVNKTGKKGFKSFLQKIEKQNNLELTNKPISNVDEIVLLQHLFEFRENCFSKLSINKWIAHIKNTYHIKLTHKTIRSYYYEHFKT